MKSLRSLSVAAFVLLAASMSFAWPACPGNWVSVPSGTHGTSSSGIGSVVTENGQTFQCQDPSSGGSSNTNNNTNNNNNVAKGGTGVGVGVGIGMGGQGGQGGQGGTAIATQGQQQGQQQGQTQSNTSTNTNTSSSSSTSAASNNGNGNGNGANDTNISSSYQAAKIPVSQAYAPTALPTAPCFKGYGAGVQGPNLGVSVGGGKVDETCQQLEVARSFAISGARKAYCDVMVTTKWAKKAKVTMEDCMYQDATPAVSIIKETAKDPVVAAVPVVDVNPHQLQ